MAKIKDIVFYIPFGVSLQKKTCTAIGLWMALSIIFFCFILTKLNGGAREIYFFYFGGLIPMLISFQDPKYVKEKIKIEFPSLFRALYRQNLIFFCMFIFVSFCALEDFHDIFTNICITTFYWCLSIPLSVIYKQNLWYMYSITVLLTSCIFLYLMNYFELGYLIPSIIVIGSVIFSICISKKIIHNTFESK